jgi:hypothetical protein
VWRAIALTQRLDLQDSQNKSGSTLQKRSREVPWALVRTKSPAVWVVHSDIHSGGGGSEAWQEGQSHGSRGQDAGMHPHKALPNNASAEWSGTFWQKLARDKHVVWMPGSRTSHAFSCGREREPGARQKQ